MARFGKSVASVLLTLPAYLVYFMTVENQAFVQLSLDPGVGETSSL